MVTHSEILLSKCAQFRDQSQFIDVRLKVHEDIFAAHRIVLAANSDYFYAMFTDGMPLGVFSSETKWLHGSGPARFASVSED